MKKFTLKAITLAAASVCGSAAFAGTITAPATDAAATPYAVESLLATTDVTLPPITYTMGVSRTTAQDFTIIYKPSAGATFLSCPAGAALVTAVVGTATASNKRSSSTECAYEVDVTAATDTTTTLTLTGLVLNDHTLNVSGNTASVVVALWDLGETARIDNSSDLTRRVAISGNALTLTAAQDAFTTADVNHASGPLFGFLADANAPADTASTAAANFVIGNNSGATTYRNPTNTADWNFVTDATSIAMTVGGNFTGMATGGFTVTPPLGAAPAVTATAAGTTATFTILPANIAAAPSANTFTASFLSAQTASLGTARTFGISGVGDVISADVTLSGNSSWWVWDANASQLMTPFFNHNVNYITRFFFLNTGAVPVSYTTQCFTEGGNAVTNGVGGTLAANATTNVPASSACTFIPGTPRGAVIFTINAPINRIKGTFQQIAPTGADGVVTPLVRPYNQANTTE